MTNVVYKIWGGICQNIPPSTAIKYFSTDCFQFKLRLMYVSAKQT
jgi:hypothetical protein